MKIGIISDIHDHLKNLRLALEYLRKDCDLMICCGDFCSPFVLEAFKMFDGNVCTVFGNNDADVYRMLGKSPNQFIHYGELAELVIYNDDLYHTADIKIKALDRSEYLIIAINHFPEIAKSLSRSGLYDVVCYGHNHQISIDKVHGCVSINPGSIMGYQPGKDVFTEPTFVIYDTKASAASGYAIDPLNHCINNI